MRLFLCILAAFCAACTSTRPEVSHRDVDEAKMSQVEENASRTGVRVYWVNPPRRPAGSN